MKNALILANWKSNKTKNEAKTWLEKVSIVKTSLDLEVVIFPPFTLLETISSYIKMNSLPFKLGAQNVSQFDSGPYTGEVSAKQIKEYADYVLIGHSERRANFKETDEMIKNKVEKTIDQGLFPIVCFSEMQQLDQLSNKDIILAYEPPGAISTSGPNASAADPNSVSEFVKKISDNFPVRVLYGGSIKSENIKQYLNLENISGVLVGGASLEPSSFTQVLTNAS